MDRSAGEGWWLASDGKWYPPEALPAVPAPPPSSVGVSEPSAGLRLRYVSAGLTNTLSGFLWASAALLGITALLFLAYWAVWRRWMDGDETYAAVSDASSLAAGFFVLWLLSALVVAVLMIIWFHNAYAASSSRGATEQRWSSGWAVGGWFIPFANLVIPKLVVNEIDEMSNPATGDPPIGDRWKLVARAAIGNWWWGLWFAGVVCLNGSLMIGNGEQSPDYGRSLLVTAGALVVLAGASVFGALYVRKLGRRLKRPMDFTHAAVVPGTRAGRDDWPDQDEWSLEPSHPVRYLSFGLTGTLAGFMWASAALYGLGIAAWLYYGQTWDEWLGSDTFEALDAAADAETLASGLNAYAYLSAIVGMILLIIWYNQAYKAASSLGATGQKWSSGWAVGGWFIPFANLVIPKLVVNEIDRMSNPETGEPQIGERWMTMLPAAIGMWWWVLLVAGFIGSFVIILMLGSTDNETYRSGITWAAPFAAVRAAGFALGAIYITRLGKRLRAPRW